MLGPHIRRWVKPTKQSWALGMAAALTRAIGLVLENAFLRQQVIVLSRSDLWGRIIHPLPDFASQLI